MRLLSVASGLWRAAGDRESPRRNRTNPANAPNNAAQYRLHITHGHHDYKRASQHENKIRTASVRWRTALPGVTSERHAALLIEERGVLVAGDMLSDVLIPLLDFNDTADPIEDYLVALRLLEGAAGDFDVLVPGHGSVGGVDQVRARIEQDRAYVLALRDAGGSGDPRVGPLATFDWLSGVHERQVRHLAQRRERDGTPG